MKKKLSVVLLLAIFMGVLTSSAKVDAVAVTVKRVVFEGSKRAEVITVINNSNRTETYRVGWRHFVMSKDKSLNPVDENALPPEVKPSNDMIRFSPRRFTLKPNETQQMRVMLRMPAGLADGEYRSHLTIRPEADVEDFKLDKKYEAAEGKTGVVFRMLAGLSMPVIVRKGDLSSTATIENFKLTKMPDHIHSEFSLLRTGNRSTYGDLDFICNAGTPGEYSISVLRNVSIYTEITQRDMTRKLIPAKDKPQCNNVTLKYSETEKFKGKIISIYDEKTAAVQ